MKDIEYMEDLPHAPWSLTTPWDRFESRPWMPYLHNFKLIFINTNHNYEPASSDGSSSTHTAKAGGKDNVPNTTSEITELPHLPTQHRRMVKQDKLRKVMPRKGSNIGTLSQEKSTNFQQAASKKGLNNKLIIVLPCAKHQIRPLDPFQ